MLFTVVCSFATPAVFDVTTKTLQVVFSRIPLVSELVLPAHCATAAAATASVAHIDGDFMSALVSKSGLHVGRETLRCTNPFVSHGYEGCANSEPNSGVNRLCGRR